jgi:hypothetical protein
MLLAVIVIGGYSDGESEKKLMVLQTWLIKKSVRCERNFYLPFVFCLPSYRSPLLQYITQGHN